ncbi:MAG: hypothetical protein GEU73_05265 [Chloroflexi bacterium]|nr:hypothetical protein [Chloroflexota bacterium]
MVNRSRHIVLVLVLALAVLAAGCAAPGRAETPPAEPAVAASATAEETSPPVLTGPVELDGAMAAVRAFVGDPTAALDEYWEKYPIQTAFRTRSPWPRAPRSGGPYPPSFYIQRTAPGVRYADKFVVDQASGEVVEANLVSSTRLGAPRRPVGETEATAAAEAFARRHFAGFEELALFGSGAFRTGVAGGDRVYEVRWQRRATDSGAWLPTYVWLGADLETGRVVLYNAVREEFDGSTIPDISREEALEIARSELEHPDLNGARTGDPELAAWYGTPLGERGRTSRLAWSIPLVGAPDGVFGDRVDIDAHSGAVLARPRMLANPGRSQGVFGAPGRDRLAICVEPIAGARIAPDEARAIVTTALGEVAKHPWWNIPRSAGPSPIANPGYDVTPPVVHTGCPLPPAALSPDLSGRVSEEPSIYRLFVFVLPPDEIERIFGPWPPTSIACLDLKERDGRTCMEEGLGGQGQFVRATTGLYLSPEELRDPLFLIEHLERALNLRWTQPPPSATRAPWDPTYEGLDLTEEQKNACRTYRVHQVECEAWLDRGGNRPPTP